MEIRNRREIGRSQFNVKRWSILRAYWSVLLLSIIGRETETKVVGLTESDWITNDNTFEYYLAITADEDTYTWHDARDFCMTRGGDLTSIISQTEQDFLISHMNSSGYLGSLWTGFNILQNTNWTWADGDTVSFINWAEGYPKENLEFPWMCGYFKVDGLWKNEHCESLRGFICKRLMNYGSTEKMTQTTIHVSGYCPSGYISVVNSNKCFRLVNLNLENGEGITFDEAANLCRSGPGLYPDLACIANAAENNAILALLGNQNFSLWIGLRRESSNYYSDYKWTDNTPIEFTNWAPDEPTKNGEYCGEVFINPGPIGAWNDIQCTKMRGYICQTYKDPNNPVNSSPLTSPNPCPNGYVPYWYACYRLYTEPKKNWPDAEATCIQDGGQLVSINNGPENGAVATYLGNEGVTDDLVWIGLEFLTNESVYHWSDGWHVTFTNWAPGQPNRTANGGCVGTNHLGFWADAICSELSSFMCKITTVTPRTTPAQMEGTCPDNTTSFKWTPYGQYCYGLSAITDDWIAAKESCRNAVQNRPCYLASIHSSLENKFIGDLVATKGVYGSFWIGMSKTGAGASYTWLDGTEVEYTNWNPGEPNDMTGSQNWVRAYAQNFAYTWDDHVSTSIIPFVCKTAKVPYPTTPPTPPHVEGVCPSDEWQAYGGDCYLFRPDEYVTWDEADQDCKALGSHLVTIFNKDENWMVHHRLLEASWFAFVRQFWIGLSKQKDSDEYFWTDGQSLASTNYTNWMLNNPSNNDSRLCVDIDGSSEVDSVNSADWSTSQCNELRGYACRIPKAPSPTQSTGANAGAIVGAVIGIIIGIGLIVAASFFGYRWYKNRQETSSSSAEGVANVGYDNRSQNGDAKNSSPAEQNNYFGELESQDLSSVRIGRLEIKD